MKNLSLILSVFLLIACSGGGGSSSSSSKISVPPTDTVGLGETGPLTVDENQTLNIQLVGTDSLSNALTYSCTFGCSHAGISLDASTGAFVWHAAFGQSGTYNMTFQATDGTVTKTFNTTIIVVFVDQTPQFTNLGPQTINVGDTLTLVPNATEANGLPLNYNVTNLPANAVWDGTTLTFTPDGSQGGGVEYDFTVEADDGQGDTNTQTLAITVN